MVNNYGYNFVIGTNEKAIMSKEEILNAYKEWSNGYNRQKARMILDIKEIEALSNNQKYFWTTRQYTGHSYLPSTMQGGKRIFISNLIHWC